MTRDVKFSLCVVRNQLTVLRNKNKQSQNVRELHCIMHSVEPDLTKIITKI